MTTRKCNLCKQDKPLSDYYVDSKNKNNYRGKCKKCCKIINNNAPCLKDPQWVLWNSARNRAKLMNVEFNLVQTDIDLSECCPYLGIRLDYTRASERDTIRDFTTPSLDRIDSSKGYVKGNIRVISFKANAAKCDATEQELVAFAKGVLKAHSGDVI